MLDGGSGFKLVRGWCVKLVILGRISRLIRATVMLHYGAKNHTVHLKCVGAKMLCFPHHLKYLTQGKLVQFTKEKCDNDGGIGTAMSKPVKTCSTLSYLPPTQNEVWIHWGFQIKCFL